MFLEHFTYSPSCFPGVVCVLQEDVETGAHLDPSLKEISYNPTYDTMFAPEVRSVRLVPASSHVWQSFLNSVQLEKKKTEWFVNT